MYPKILPIYENMYKLLPGQGRPIVSKRNKKLGHFFKFFSNVRSLCDVDKRR